MGLDYLFFPEADGKDRAKNIAEAQALCLDCPVFAKCKAYQKRSKSEYGVWAGKFYSPKS